MNSDRSTSPIARLTRYGTLALLVSSVFLNVILGQRLRAFSTPGVTPAVGSVAPRLAVKTLAGEPVDIAIAGKPAILYYFSPQCAWCEKNWTNIKALIAATEGQYRFIGLSTVPEVAAYLDERRLSFEVYSGMSLETVRALGLGSTPHTIVVSARGRIQYTWAGAFAGAQQAAVEHAFGVTLPGIRTAATTHGRDAAGPDR